jgi:D-alanine-D-alanine ligase
MPDKLRVAVVFGGRSGEHEVSLISAQSVIDALDREKYEVIPVGITREGYWLTEDDPMAELQSLLSDKSPSPEETGLPPGRRALVPGIGGHGFPEVDVLFPVLHGPYGEDGTIQGLSEMAAIPCVGAGVAGSALAMDKALFKDIMRAHGLPIVDHVLVRVAEWQRRPQVVLDWIQSKLGFPVFTKPANMGSSVGISKCRDREGLNQGLAEAAEYDGKLLVEAAVPNAREIEVSVLGNDDPITSIPGEIVPSREFYSYEAKYLDDGEEASELLIPAPISPQMAGRVRELATQAFVAIDGAGMARADFLLAGETGELYVNELNTIPGFTPISMYPKLWEASGLPYPRLLDRLIELALERFAERKRYRVTH